jgi:GxxExxY protein
MKANEATEQIIASAIEVHRALGPGLLESAYEACLVYELTQRGLYFQRQSPLPVVYKDVVIDCGYRLDLLVDRQIVVELKAIDRIAPIHEAQLLSYLKLSGCQIGLLINFNVRLLKEGIRRRVLGRQEESISALSAASAVNLSTSDGDFGDSSHVLRTPRRHETC